MALAADGNGVSLKITTERFSKMAGVTRATGTTSGRNAGVLPIASAFERYRLASPRSPLSTIATDTGALGETTKWNVLSAGSRSVPARTVPRTFASATVNGAKVIDVDERGATVTAFDSSSRPSTDSTTGTLAGCSPRLVIPAVTATRSWPENADRAKVTDGTETLAVSAATDIVVSVMSSGKRASSALPQPPFWKSLISTASRRLSADWLRMLSASFSAGP